MQKLSKAEVSSYKISLNLLKTIKKFNLELKTLAQFPPPQTPVQPFFQKMLQLQMTRLRKMRDTYTILQKQCLSLSECKQL